VARAAHVALSPTHSLHGQPEKETPSENEQAQAPKALEGEPPQKAHVAEVKGAKFVRAAAVEPAAHRGGFVFCRGLTAGPDPRGPGRAGVRPVNSA
jgi:hypothetical protein